jgi:hypothetical protein
MKNWQIFAIGMVALAAALLLPMYESLIAGVGALAIIAIVVVGFALHPRKEIFYLRTNAYVLDPDCMSLEHNRIAVRVELARLWLLFVPTFGAVAFLLVTFAKGTPWRFSLWDSGFDRLLESGPYPVVLFCRLLFAAVIGLLSTWLSERWVLRDAEACSAGSVSQLVGRILYGFKDRSGEYYGGEGFPCAPVHPRELATIVLYRISKPDLNKIAMCCLFHRLVIVGRGVTDLDEATVTAHSVPARTVSQALKSMVLE